ncbi:MAG: UDP-N-acetylmuramoyl-L-alanine--D-glutamate ligase [Thermaurantimonas sp.]|uniref:UDP-N-acetylmuramoyl-L-alanine--D-glutamate ligase n=1 Tax=Thermaurantimonas sp. TaxID=2681568 RepID=UPI00391D292F
MRDKGFKKIAIIGAGESGTGAALLGKHLGLDVYLSDAGKVAEKYASKLRNALIDFEEGSHDLERILSADVVIKSPGVPDKAPVVKKALEAGRKVISEIEFASYYTDKPIIAITGTNGKTTTTSLTGHIFLKGGVKTGIGGNIGKSFAELVIDDHQYEAYVLEVSSFQLDGCYTFAPDVAILTNITPDHLDRYEYKFENYIASKFRIAQAQRENQVFVYCADDPVTVAYMPKYPIRARKVPFSAQIEPEEGAFLVNENEFIVKIKNMETMVIKEFKLKGTHNAYNSMAAAIAARIHEIRQEKIKEAFSDFEGVEHRLEHAGTIGGIDFINDSKATNVNSVLYALGSIKRPIVWIAGGVDKGNDYSTLHQLVKDRVKAIVCLGKDNSKLLDEFTGMVNVIADTHSMEQAVKTAYSLASKGDVVLLSPACASFDLFENYEDRGNQFKYWVRQL